MPYELECCAVRKQHIPEVRMLRYTNVESYKKREKRIEFSFYIRE